MHFSVRTRSQNALFRRVRLSSPAQTSACLTERRILYPPPHGKAHSGSTQPQDQGLRARRLPAEIGLELGGRLRQYAHEELAGQAKPIDPNGTTGPWRPTGHRPTTIMASITPWPMPQPMAQGRP